MRTSFRIALLLWYIGLTINLPAQRDSGWVPFEYVKNTVIIPVTVEGETYRFVLDTGGILEIVPAIRDRLQLPVLDAVTVTGINKAEKELIAVALPELSIGSLPFQGYRALVNEQNLQYPTSCFALDGMIGRDMLTGMALQLDYENQRLRLTEDVTTLALDTTARTPTRYGLEQVIQVEVVLEGEPTFIKFDLGSGDLFSYQTKQAKRRPKRQRRQYEGLFSFGVTQKGIKTQKRYQNHVSTLTIAGSTFSDFWSNFSKASSARLGAAVIKYGIVTLDYKNNWFYFEPYTSQVSIPQQSTPGFAIRYAESNYVVKWVLDGSEAEQAGIQEGLEVLSINGVNLKEQGDPCEDYLASYPLLNASEIAVEWLDKNGVIQQAILMAK